MRGRSAGGRVTLASVADGASGGVDAGSDVTKASSPSWEDAEALIGQLQRQLSVLRGRGQAEAETAAELQELLLTAERQTAQLQNLYVAMFQLHSSLELYNVRKAICEIAVDLLGADQYALLERDAEHGGFIVAAHGEGIGAPFAAGTYPGGDALVDAALSGGEVRLAPVDGSSAIAAVPLRAQGELLGVLVIVSLLRQKRELGPEDLALMQMVAAHAASALFAAQLFNERTRKLRTLEGLMGLLRPAGTPEGTPGGTPGGTP